MLARLIIVAVLTSVILPLCAAEHLIKTSDGQTLQGEYLGSDNDAVRLRTRFGIVSIPKKDIQTQAVVVSGKAEPAAPAASLPRADAAPVEAAPEEEELFFEKQKMPDVAALSAARIGEFTFPEPSKLERQELFRLIRNFGDTNESGRNKILRTLQNFGLTAQPFIASAYDLPHELDIRIELLRALAVPGRTLTAGIFQEAHREALASYGGTQAEPAPLPPPYLSKRDRDQPQSRADFVRMASRDVLQVEEYASLAGGPLNTLFLLQLYLKRYAAETVDPLLSDAARDRNRLSTAAADATRSRSAWTKADRVMLLELLFPLLFEENDDLKSLARETLKRLLPSTHPKWTASQTDWVKWWHKTREKI